LVDPGSIKRYEQNGKLILIKDTPGTPESFSKRLNIVGIARDMESQERLRAGAVGERSTARQVRFCGEKIGVFGKRRGKNG
jgi:hypothetical protein